jgi:hypothetical protein
MGRTFRRIAFCLTTLWLLPGAAQAQCPDQPFDAFEAQGYMVRVVRVSGPLVRASGLTERVAEAQVTAGTPVSAAAIEAAKEAVRSAIRDTPSLFDSPITATVVIADVEACDTATKQLDVVYRIFTTKIALALSRTPEERAISTADPSARLALAATPVRYRVAPIVRYNELENLVVGGRGWVALGPGRGRFDVAVEASDEVANVDLVFTGSRESDAGFLRALEWNLGYHRRDRPTEERTLHEQRVNGQAIGVTRPMGAAGAVFRFATSLQGGSEKTDLPAEPLPIGVLAASNSGVWKGAAGVTLQSRRHTLAGSYGLQLGFTRGDEAVDYVKSIGEVSYDGRLILRASMRRHPLEVASRFGAGRLSGDDGIPLSERFFGGNSAVPFVDGQGWDFRSNPVLRSFPASGFDSSAGGRNVGGDYFVSLNLTAAMPVWVRPLVPADVSSDSFIRESLNGQLASAQQTLETIHRIPDPAHLRAVEAARPLEQHVKALQSRLAEIMSSIPSPLKEVASSCDDQAAEFLPVAESVSEKTYVGSLLANPVDEGDATLSSIIRLCIDELNGKLGDAAIARIGAQLTGTRQEIADNIAQIDAAGAKRLAARDMAFARGTVATILDEMNAISLAPVFIVDAARLGQHAPPSSNVTRYGLGTGVRLSLASAFHLSGGYTWNVNRSASERRGATFLMVEVATLFGR